MAINDNLAYEDSDSLFHKLQVAYIIFMNHGQAEDYYKFEQAMDDFVGLLIAKLMINRSYSGAGDVLFAGLLYQTDRVMNFDLAKPIDIGFRGLTLTLSINPLLFYWYYKEPKAMLAGIRQIVYHVMFDHLTLYDWAFHDEEDAKVMTLAMDAEVNQYVNDLPHHAVTLDWLRDLVADKGLAAKQGSLFYYQKMKEILQDPAKQGYDKINSAIENMQGSGQMNETYSQLKDNFDPNKAEELRIETAQQLSEVMKQNHSMQPVKPDGKNVDLHQKLANGLILRAYEDMPEEMREHLSGKFQDKIQQITKKRVLNWKDVIQKGIGNVPIPYQFSKNRVNRRQPQRIDLPGRILAQVSRLIVFLDTSASQNEEALAYSLGELANMQKSLGMAIWVVQIDTKVVKAELLSPATVKNFSISGRGGTSFAPAYKWLHDNGFNDSNSVAVYFTDGYGDDGFERYGYRNMYWVLTTADPGEPNPLSTDGLGKVLYLKADEKYNKMILNGSRSEVNPC